MSASPSAIRAAFERGGVVDLPELVFGQLVAYLELLIRWNARLNLTSIREPSEIIRRHLVECGFFAQRLPRDVSSLMDYGTGAGLPGLVVAVCRPEVKVTLAEAHARKAAFLREAIRSLNIACDVYHGRVEAMPTASTFDVVSMRAVEKMGQAIPIALRHVDRYLALLTTEKLASDYRVEFPGLEWMAPTPLPDSENMILALAVPRGTNSGNLR